MAEKKVIEIDIESNIGSLKSQLREAQAEVANLSDKFGATSKEAAEAAKRAAELKDKIGDAKALTDAFNPDAKFNALSASIGGVLNGFQAYEGALGLIGVESEQVQATLLKVQSAMALSQGLQGLLEAKDSFKQLGAVVKNNSIIQAAYAFIMGTTTTAVEANTIATETNTAVGEVAAVTTEVQAGANVALTATTNTASLALKAFRAALIATGIGAIVVLIGLLIANFDKVTQVIQKLSGYVIKAYDYFDNLGASIKILIGIFFPMIGVIYTAIKALEYFNVIDTKTEREQNARHKLELKRADEKIKKLEQQKKARDKAYGDEQKQLERQIALLEAQGKSTDALEEKKIKASINYQKQKLKELELEQQSLGFMIKSTGTIGQAYQGLFDENAKAIDDIKNNILDSENQLKINSAKATKERLDAIKDAEKDTAKEIDLTKDELYQLQQQRLEQQNKDELDAILKSEQAVKDANKLKLQQEQEYLNQLESIQEQNFQFGLTEQQREIQAVNDKYFALEELAKGNAEQLAIIEKAKNDELAVINDKYTKEEIARQNTLKQTKLKLAGEAFGAIAGLIESFNAKDEATARKQFKVAKAFNLSASLVNTALAVTSALALRPDQSVFPGQRFVEAGLAATTGLASVVKIASTEFGSGGSGSSSSSSGGGGSNFTPSFNVVGNSGINQLASLNQQPIKAYVTAGDVSSALSLERNTLQKSTF